jgi:hypothetical protein
MMNRGKFPGGSLPGIPSTDLSYQFVVAAGKDTIIRPQPSGAGTVFKKS